MKGWKEVTFNSVYLGLYDGPHATPKESETGAIFLGIKNVTEDGRLDLSDIRYIAEEDLPKWTKRITPKAGDIVFSYEATLHRYSLIPKNFRGCLGRRMALVRVNPEVADNRFVLHYMLSPIWRKEVERNILTGATVDRIPLTNVPNFRFYLPPLLIQRRIASILSAYDDLIENNLRRIKLLEELAQRTYEEWFVRFRFPGFEASNINSDWLPEGWERKKLGEVIDYEIGGGWGNDEPTDEFSASGFVIRGTDMNNLILGNIENVPYRYHKPSNMASRKIQHGDILFEVSGGSSNEGVGKTMLMVDKIIDQFFDDIMCASFCKLVRPISVEYSNYLFLFFQFLRKAKTTEIWEIRSASNIVNYNWTSFLKYQDVIVPEVNTLRKFNSFVDDLVDQIYSLGNQNRLLKESRDILLPRLMSGEIELDELRNMEDGMLMAAEPKGEYKTLKNHG